MPITEGGRFTPHNRIVSPGVFSRENDLSGIAQGVADIGAVVVAPFAKGPGFAPTVCDSVGELEDKFGIADGTYYGSYTAAEYLKEKGFVTVCRVGALTGYHQKYPFVIYAESGEWTRMVDAGNVVPVSSYVTIANSSSISFERSGSLATTYVGANATSPIYSGSLTITSVPVVVTFQPGGGKWGNTAVGSASLSGSMVYYGQQVAIGNATITMPNFSQSITVATSSYTKAAAATALLTIDTGTLNLYTQSATITLTGGANPFNSVTVTSGSIIPVSGACATRTFLFSGIVNGTFGPYTGEFTPNSTQIYNPCSASWSGAGSYKILAVLADTQNATINSDLEAPGFAGTSSLSYVSFVSQSAVGLNFNLALYPTDTSTAYGTYNFSLDSNSTKYISTVFGRDATVGNPAEYATGTKKEAAYLYKFFENDLAAVTADPTKWRIVGGAFPSGSFDGETMKFVDAYSLDLTNGDSEFGLTNAYSPWVISQEIATWGTLATSIRYPLFRAQTLTDGTNANTSYKIEISNVRLAGQVAGTDWGTFTLTVRDYSDTDRKPKILESFNNLSLDPDSANYVARRIGDRYNYIRYDGKIIEYGDFANLSRYIRIEMSANPVPVAAVPYGFQAYALPINSSAGYWCAPMQYSKASVYSLFPGKYPSGVVFNDAPTGADAELASLYPTSSTGIGVSDDSKQYFTPLPAFGAYSSVGRNTFFALDVAVTNGGIGSGSFFSGSNAVPATYDAANETTHVKMRKFVFGLQGGFDGQSPAIPINIGADISPGNTQGLNCATSTTAGSVAYNQCVGALGNADEFDINLISTPGIIYSYHSYVTNLAVDMCETRGDCFYIPDLYLDDGNPSSGQIDEVVALAAEFDTSYAGAYYPWIKIKNIYTNKIEAVPPSVVLPSIYAANDRVAGEWWAVAGLSRGGIPQAVGVTDRTTHTERDTLYEGRVNPIAAFPGQGISVWGQKTLQVASSALDRINVRRLLIEIKKFFATTARYLVFEQNTAQTRNKFLAIVNPYLESVQQRSGLYAFQVVMDDTNNTPDLVDRNILYGQIWLKPTKTAEFIVLDFNILPTGAMFPTA
jgi:hypothetical protein